MPTGRAAVVGVLVGAVLHAVGIREPPEVVVERAVLHHQHDEVVHRHVLWGGQPRRQRLPLRGLAEEQIDRQRDGCGGKAGRVGGARQEVAAPHGGLRCLRHRALVRLRV